MQGEKVEWTEEKDHLIRANYKVIGANETAKLLGVSLKTISSRASALGLTQKVQILNEKERDYKLHRLRMKKIKEKASQGMLKGHKVISLYEDKVVLEFKGKDEATYNRCYTFNELALM